jgi:hypothetical protein
MSGTTATQAAGPAFQTGFEAQVVFVGAFGQIDLGYIKMWDCRQRTADIIVNPLNSPPVPRFLPKGWDFSFTIARSTANLDAYYALKEMLFWSGAPLLAETMYVYITNSDGSVSIFQFTNCQSTLEDAGSYQADKEVDQKVKGFAAQRIQVA